MPTAKLIHIAILPGDGIGAEVVDAALPIFTALAIPVKLMFAEVGWHAWVTSGSALPISTWEVIQQADTVLLGAVTSKPPREARHELAVDLQNHNLNYVSPLIQLRQQLDLFANVRPCFNLGIDKRAYNYCIIRENTEGLYSGLDYYPLPANLKEVIAADPFWSARAVDELSCTLRVQTKAGLLRLFNFAFEYALSHGITRVTWADKPNVLRKSGDFAREHFEAVAQGYPTITADILNVDAVALWLVKRPEQFGVIVAENMFGDILSDVGAAVMGGLGLAPSANIGKYNSYFEPVHGSAPQMKPNTANPSAMFLTISMLLEHFGYSVAAKQLIAAVSRVIKEGQFITYDLGGKASTRDMAQAIIERVREQSIEV